MKNHTQLSDFVPKGRFGFDSTDDAVLEGFSKYLVSYDAPTAFCGYLGVACEIATQRPHLFARLLPTVIDPACCMGVESAESLISYARQLIEHNARQPPKLQQFTPAAIRYFDQFINSHTAEIQLALDQWDSNFLNPEIPTSEPNST